MVATFAQVGLGCFQAINVVEDRPGWVAATSIAQSFAALTLYKEAPHADSVEAILGFTFGAVCGGQLALVVGRRRRRALAQKAGK